MQKIKRKWRAELDRNEHVLTLSTVACYQLGKYYIIMLLCPLLHYNIINHNFHCMYLPNSIIKTFARIYIQHITFD